MTTTIEIAKVTFAGGVRDKVFKTLLIVSALCFLVAVPTVSALSMRQVREVAVSLSLSLVSLVSLVLTLFMGVTLVYRDIEKRFAHAVLSLPVTGGSYIIGKFSGLVLIIGAGMLIMAIFSAAGIGLSSALHRSSPMIWENFVAALFLEFAGLWIVAAISVFFSSFSTTAFVPLFATIGIYSVGNMSQTVMEYLQGFYGKDVPASSMYLSKIAYYLFPNMSAFDLKANAIYGMQISPLVAGTALLYGLLYTAIVLGGAVLAFRHRELN